MRQLDQYEGVLRRLQGRLEKTLSSRESTMETNTHVGKLQAVMQEAREAGTLEQSKTLLFQWLLAAQDEDMSEFLKLQPAETGSNEARLISGFRALDTRRQLAVLGAVESVAGKDKAAETQQQPAAEVTAAAVARGRHNFFGSVTHVADSISNLYINGHKQAGGKS